MVNQENRSKTINQIGKGSTRTVIVLLLILAIVIFFSALATRLKTIKSQGRAAQVSLQINPLRPHATVERSLDVHIDNIRDLTGFGLTIGLKDGVDINTVADIHTEAMTDWFPLGDVLVDSVDTTTIQHVRGIDPPGRDGGGTVLRITYKYDDNNAPNPFEIKGVAVVFGDDVKDYLNKFQCPSDKSADDNSLTISGPGVPCQ